jgi:enoyl-CoA hydratase/carnithine racemase
MRDEITQQLEDWAADPAVRVLVLTGAGPTFCAGFDLNEFGQGGLAQRIKDSSRRYHLAVWHFPKPLIAAVNGPAMGGGMDLSVRVTAESLPAQRHSGIRRSSSAPRRCSPRVNGLSA